MKRQDRLLFIPGPVMVEEDVLLESAKPVVNHRGERFHEIFEEVVERLRKVLRTENEVVIFTASGSGAVEALASNFGPRRKAVVINAGEFGARFSEALKTYGANVVEVTAQLGDAPSLEQVAERIQIEKPDIVAFVYNDTSPGIRLSYIRELCKVAKEHGALTLVDAVSAAGGDELDIDSWGIDGLAAASQKCLAAPPGLSFVVLSEEAKEKIVRPPVTVYFDLRRYIEFNRRSETPFTPAVTLFTALSKALERILRFGVDEWVKMHVERSVVLYNAIQKLGLRPFVREIYRSRTVLSFATPDGVSASELRKRLAEAYGIEVASGMGALKDRIIRLGVMGPIKHADILALVTALGLELERLGVQGDLDGALREVARLKVYS
ncbi:MAG: alanine--glyoxylate aminotransferase family protein [Thermofilaceae archaeon]